MTEDFARTPFFATEGIDGRTTLERLARAPTVVVKTNKVDLHGRYVGHLFYSGREQAPAEVFAKGRYLNAELVAQGLAKVL